MILWAVNYATSEDFDCMMDDHGFDTIADVAEPRVLRRLFKTMREALDYGEAAMRHDQLNILDYDDNEAEIDELNTLTRVDEGSQRILKNSAGEVYAVIVACEMECE